MSYLEWKSYARSRMELEDELRLELEDELGLEDELRLEAADNVLELKSAAELLNSCRRAKARKASKTKHMKKFSVYPFFYPVFTLAKAKKAK